MRYLFTILFTLCASLNFAQTTDDDLSVDGDVKDKEDNTVTFTANGITFEMIPVEG